MPKVFDRLFFIGPMSLGDAFIMNGIAHYFGDQCEELHIPCLPQYYDTIQTLYQDHSHIKVVPLLPYHQGENQYVETHKLSRILRNSIYTIMIDGISVPVAFDQQYYDFYNLSYSLRYKNFRLPKFIDGAEELYNQLSKDGPYALVHNKMSTHPNGVDLNLNQFRLEKGSPPLKIIEIDETLDGRNLLRWVKLIRNATEIHCISSSFWNLVDNMFDQTKATLFFHDIRKFSCTRVNSEWNNACWNVVNYNNKI